MEGVGAEISQRDDGPTLATLGPRGRQMRVDRAGPVNESAAKASLHLQENGAATVMSVSKLQLPCSCCRANPRFQFPNGAVCSSGNSGNSLHHHLDASQVTGLYGLSDGSVCAWPRACSIPLSAASRDGTLIFPVRDPFSPPPKRRFFHSFVCTVAILSLFWFLDGIEKRESSKRK